MIFYSFFKIIDFGQVKSRTPDNSYAGLYLHRCNKESKSDDEIDIEVFTRLSELDSKLGTPASEQLLQIILRTTRSDIIKVCMFVCAAGFLIILVYRL